MSSTTDTAPDPNCWTCNGTGKVRGTEIDCPCKVVIPPEAFPLPEPEELES